MPVGGRAMRTIRPSRFHRLAASSAADVVLGPAFDAGAVAREMGRGKQFFPGINTLRIWLSHQAFLRYGPAPFLERLG